MPKQVTKRHEDQLEAIAEDVRSAFSEDLVFTSEAQVREAVEILKARLNKIADQADTYIHE